MTTDRLSAEELADIRGGIAAHNCGSCDTELDDLLESYAAIQSELATSEAARDAAEEALERSDERVTNLLRHLQDVDEFAGVEEAMKAVLGKFAHTEEEQ